MTYQLAEIQMNTSDLFKLSNTMLNMARFVQLHGNQVREHLKVVMIVRRLRNIGRKNSQNENNKILKYHLFNILLSSLTHN
jgi:hypothetical protein